MNRKPAFLFLLAVLTLPAAFPAMAESEPEGRLWIEPLSMIYGWTGGTPRVIAGGGFPLGQTLALDFRILLDGSFQEGEEYGQIKLESLLRWFPGTGREGARQKGLYLAGGAGLAAARTWGGTDLTVLAGSLTGEAGWRWEILSRRFFLEPFGGASVLSGPRFGGPGGWETNTGLNLGLRCGITLGRGSSGKP